MTKFLFSVKKSFYRSLVAVFRKVDEQLNLFLMGIKAGSRGETDRPVLDLLPSPEQILVAFLRFSKRYVRSSQKVVAAAMVLALLLELFYPAVKAYQGDDIETQAEVVDFYPTDYQNFLYEHKSNEFQAYFGDQNNQTKHAFRFERENKGIEVSLVPNLPSPAPLRDEVLESEFSEELTPSLAEGLALSPTEALTAPSEVLGEAVSPTPLSEGEAQAEKIAEELKGISSEITKLEKELQEIEGEAEKTGQAVREIVQGTVLTHVDGLEVVKTTEVLPNMDILYATLEDGIKEEIVLKLPPESLVAGENSATYQLPVTFSLTLEGVYAAKPPGEEEWAFFDLHTTCLLLT